MADEVRAPGGGLAVGRGEHQLGTGEGGQRHRHVVAVGLLELGISVDPDDDRTAIVAGGLETLLQRRQAMESAQFVEQKPKLQIRGARPRHERVHGRVHPDREQPGGHRHVDIAC